MSILKTLNNMHSYICTLYGKTLVGRYTNRKLLLEFLKKINNKDFNFYSVFYPIGNGSFNIDKSIEDIKWIISNMEVKLWNI